MVSLNSDITNSDAWTIFVLCFSVIQVLIVVLWNSRNKELDKRERTQNEINDELRRNCKEIQDNTVTMNQLIIRAESTLEYLAAEVKELKKRK